MNRSPYSAYRGRKSALQRVLIAIVILLVIALAVAIVALFVLPRYVVDTPNGPQLVLPLFGSGSSSATPGPVQTAEVTAAPTAQATDGNVVVEPPSATPSPTPSPAPDLADYVPRDIPLGLALTPVDDLEATGNNGILVDMTDVDLAQAGSGLSKGLAAAPYAAAYFHLGGSQSVGTEICITLASLGFDEIVLAEEVPQGSGEHLGDDLAQRYVNLKTALDDAGWQGRLGLVLNQDLFDSKYGDGLIPAIAQSFDRLYFRTTLKSANKTALTNGGFTANGYTLVTVVQNVANLNYAWAILP